MSVLNELLDANERFAAQFQFGELPRPPARGVVILTCLDARIMPAQALGLSAGDAHVIRNAGGRAADALRSIAISTRLLGTRTIVVMHHTDCGLHASSNEQIRERFFSELGTRAGEHASQIDFLPFTDLEESVRDDVALIRASPLIAPDVDILGFVYDVRTGRVSLVG